MRSISQFYQNDILAFDRLALREINRLMPPFAHQRITLKEMILRKFLWVQIMRGGAKTTTIARGVLDYCLMFNKMPAILTAPSFRQALMIFDEVIRIIEIEARNDNAAFPIMNEILGEIKRNTMESVVRFRNGSSIKAVPMGDGQKIRGLRGGLLVVDEAYQITEEMFESHLKPFTVVKQGGRDSKIIMMTTSSFQDCFAYKRLMQIASEVRAGNPLYGILDFTLEDLVEENFPLDKDVWKDAQRHGNPMTYAMTYYNIWPSSGFRWYEQKAIDDALSTQHSVPVEMERPAGDKSPYMVMVDLAASENGDSTCILTAKWNETDQRAEFVYGYKAKGLSPHERAWEVHRVREAFRPDWITYDAHGAIGVDLRKDLASDKLVVRGEIKKVQPLIHHDDMNLKGTRILIPIKVKDKIVTRSLMGPKDGTEIQGEDGLANLLHTKCRDLLWDGKLVGPAIGGKDVENPEDAAYSGSEQQARDVAREAFQQLSKIGPAKDKDGQQIITKSGQLQFKTTYGYNDDGGMCIVYGCVPVLRYMGETNHQGRPKGFSVAMTQGDILSGHTTEYNRQELKFN